MVVRLERGKGIVFLILIMCYCIVGPNDLHGQHRKVRFQHLTIEDGLAQNMVDCILQDSQGFIWIGTWNGLCRYDGYTLEVFNQESSRSNSLNNNFIYALSEDQFGNLWIGTAEGLYLYIYNKSQFIPVTQLIEGNDQELGGVITDITSITDSTMLVGTSSGIIRVKAINKHGELQVSGKYLFGTGKNMLRGSRVNSVMKDSKGYIWVGTDEGISKVNPGGSKMSFVTNDPDNSNSLSSNQVLKIFESGTGDIWVGTEFGLNRYFPETGGFLRFHHDPSDQESLLHNTVMDILEDRSGDLLIATLGGLSILEKDMMKFTNYKNDIKSRYSLNNDFINCLLRDDRNNIWIGTERGGVNFYNINQNTFEHFESEIGNENSLSHSTINSIYEDEEHIWIGTAGGGLNKYIKRTKQFVHYMHDPNDNGSISSDFVTSIHADQQGRLWVGTWGEGLNLLKKGSGANERFIHYRNQNSGLVSNFVSSIVEDQDRAIWVGTIGGLSRLRLGNERFETVFSGSDGLKISGVGCLNYNSKGDLWVGTRTGLFQIRDIAQGNLSDFKVREFKQSPSEGNSISGNYVISALEDSEGNMWFGTYGQGINKLNVTGDSLWFETFTSANGISNNIIYGMQEDNMGNLWLSTDYGLTRFDLKEGHIRNFYISDGLLNNQYYWSASYKNDSGKLYFGGMNGLDTFYPNWIKDVILSSEVVLTDIKLLNESVVPGREYNGVEVLQKNVSKADVVNLSYKEKIFAIEFSSFNYQEPGMIRYAYYLEGFDDHWNYVASNRRYANYTNLKPGTYTFKVKASASNGEFTSSPTSVRIYIAPPFWDTMWFRSLCVVLLIGLILGYIRVRTYHLKRQKRILEEQVRERTERINQQKEALSFQAIQLQNNNSELEQKKELIEGQNQKLEVQNKEILNQRDELIELNKKLKLVSQLRLSFFTNISHEFRTPLTLILGPIEKLLKERKLDLDVQNTLNIMNRNAQRLLHLINQIMDFRKIEKGRMDLKVTRGNFKTFCKNIFAAFQPLSEIKGTEFVYTINAVPDEVWFDTQKLENILYNLLSNAFKYTPGKGCVQVEVRGLTYEESRLDLEETHLTEDKNVISIKVIDSGIGISEENIPLVFKRFYRIHSEEAFKIGGSGIGLALAKELIRTHHGEIFLESQLGKGSVFEVQFPCLRGSYGVEELKEGENESLNIYQQVEILKHELLDKEEDQMEEDVAESLSKDRPTVLVVEDNSDLRKFVAHRLNGNYNILEAGDGGAGLKLAVKHNPDIIISDVMMPKMDGLELCASIKNNLATSHIPVILLTAKSSIENQIEGLEIGADDYLPKPFNFELLEARVQNLIDSRSKLRLLFLKSADFSTSDITTNTKDQKFLEHAINIVEENMEGSGFGVQEFVKLMGISRSLLHKKLTALTDQSAAEFINQLRMKKSMQLLRQNELNISQVAYAVGYNDPKYFSRLFSKHYGQSPKEFLNNSLTVNS